MKRISEMISQQEIISVRCVPPAFVVPGGRYRGVYLTPDILSPTSTPWIPYPLDTHHQIPYPQIPYPWIP